MGGEGEAKDRTWRRRRGRLLTEPNVIVYWDESLPCRSAAGGLETLLRRVVSAMGD